MPIGQDKAFELTKRFGEEPGRRTAASGEAPAIIAGKHRPLDQDPRLTVIIPTKDRTEDLRRTVASLLRQTRLPDDLVIVDQSKTNECAEAISRFFATPPARAAGRSTKLTYMRDPGISGGAQARNWGIELARGDTWLFLDDDVELESDFICELLAAYAQHPEATGISGIITNYCPPPLISRLWSNLFVRGPFRDDRQPVYLHADALADANPVRVSRLGGGLMSFRAAAVGRVRFDENLTGVCDGEDVDFCMQLGPHAQLLIAPRARLAHNQSPSGRARDHWLRRFSQANCYLFRRNWQVKLGGRAYFAWLRVGLALAAGLTCVRSRSRAPWMALRTGLRKGREFAGGSEDTNGGQRGA